jgi:predicted O-methyltransferase YrrM
MSSLVSLLEKYQSVDNGHGTDKNTSHSYGELYETLFEKYRDTATNILEIGVFSGASAQVWTEYFPNAHIDGIDITLSRVRFGQNNPRISFYQMDGTTQSTKDKFVEKCYDIIIDDGSHLPHHQIESFKLFAPLLCTGGIYVIEDIDGHHAHQVQQETLRVAQEYGLRTEWYDLRKKKNRWDDIVAVFYR